MSKELLLVAEALSNERGVSKDVILLAIQAALESATRKIFGLDIGVRISLIPVQVNMLPLDTGTWWMRTS